MSLGFDLRAIFQTRTRQDVIDCTGFIARGISPDYFKRNPSLIIEIVGLGNFGKTLVAESFINFMSDTLTPSIIEEDNKMRWETSPTSAFSYHANGAFRHYKTGQPISASFLRDGKHIKEFGISPSKDKPHLIFIAHKGYSLEPVTPDLTISFREKDRLTTPQWEHTIHANAKENLHNKNLQTAFEQLTSRKLTATI